MRRTGQLINLTEFERWRLARIPECQICGARSRDELRTIMINLRDEIARLQEEGYFAEAIMMEESFSHDKLHEMYNGSRVDIDAVIEEVRWEPQQ